MRRLLLVVLLAISPWAARADETLQAFLEQTVTAARDKYKLPAIAALVQVNGKAEAKAAVGIRALEHPERVTQNDRWHLGSDTKAITATLIARLVEQKQLAFDDSLATLLPALANQIDPAYRTVTLTQLLSHTAGLPALSDPKDLDPFMAAVRSATGVKAQREAVARKFLALAPTGKPGDFAYSNLGYVIAGAIAEARTGKTWEELVREQVFVPLGMTSAGFGPPSTPGKVDQPLGHVEVAGKLTPLDPGAVLADNAPALGPAGTIHVSLEDWAKFVQDQLDGARGRGKLLRPETYRKLQTPVSGNYALGWGAQVAPDGTPAALMHAGSNGFWLAYVRVLVARDTFVLVAMNAGHPPASSAMREIVEAVGERLKR